MSVGSVTREVAAPPVGMENGAMIQEDVTVSITLTPYRHTAWNQSGNCNSNYYIYNITQFAAIRMRSK